MHVIGGEAGVMSRRDAYGRCTTLPEYPVGGVAGVPD